MPSELDEIKDKISEARKRKEQEETFANRRKMARIYEDITEKRCQAEERREKEFQDRQAQKRIKLLCSICLFLLGCSSCAYALHESFGLIGRFQTAQCLRLDCASSEAMEVKSYLVGILERLPEGGHAKDPSFTKASDGVRADYLESLSHLKGRHFNFSSIAVNRADGTYDVICEFPDMGGYAAKIARTQDGYAIKSLETLF